MVPRRCAAPTSASTAARPLITVCGPREQVTIVNTVRLHTPGEFLSIGAPVPNTNVYVLDDDMNPCSIGQPGVMWAGGACVSKGYLNMPDKTAERYRLDPFVNDGCVRALLSFRSPRYGVWGVRSGGQLTSRSAAAGASCSAPGTSAGGAITGSSSTWAASTTR